MEKNYNVSTDKVSQQSDVQVFAERIKEFFLYLITKVKTTLVPSVIKLFYKLNILRDIESELTYENQQDSEYTIRIVNASNHAKQVALLDLAVFTSLEIQECIIEEKTLKETVIEFQVVKSRLFIENRSAKGNFLYEGALVEQVVKNLNEMTSTLKKVYIDFFKEEVYQYHCSSILDIRYEDVFDEKWVNKISEKLSDFHDENILTAEYPREVINKFKFIYMLIKIQEIKYEAIAKTK